MLDAAAAAQEAFYGGLNVAAVTGLATVFQHPPEDTQPPVVLIGSISLEPMGGKDGGLDRATVDIVTFVREPDQAMLFALQAAVRDMLDGQPVHAFAALLSDPVLLSAEVQLLEDGETYMGTQRFETIVQPA